MQNLFVKELIIRYAKNCCDLKSLRKSTRRKKLQNVEVCQRREKASTINESIKVFKKDAYKSQGKNSCLEGLFTGNWSPALADNLNLSGGIT